MKTVQYIEGVRWCCIGEHLTKTLSFAHRHSGSSSPQTHAALAMLRGMRLLDAARPQLSCVHACASMACSGCDAAFGNNGAKVVTLQKIEWASENISMLVHELHLLHGCSLVINVQQCHQLQCNA